MLISEKIFELLKEQKVSQKVFSQRTGIPESTISDWKRKKLNPSADKLLVIGKVLGVPVEELLGADDNRAGEVDFSFAREEKELIEAFRDLEESDKRRLVAYAVKLLELKSRSEGGDGQKEPVVIAFEPGEAEGRTEAAASDADLLIKKQLTRKLRRLARLSRITLDESEHSSGLNRHLFRYLDYLGIDKLEFIKEYLSHLQPFMIEEVRSQEKFENAVCVLDEWYRISIYIKVDATRNEEVIVSFHENNKRGIAKRNSLYKRQEYVYVFADSIGSHLAGTDNYSVNLFIMRGVKVFPLSVAAVKYDDEGFLVRVTNISNSLLEISNRYLEDLYTSDLDFSGIELFSSLQQLSFTSYGNDVFSNISIMIDSIIVQKDAGGRQIADAALCIYCSSLKLTDADRTELLETLKQRFSVNSVKVLPRILERVEQNIY
ncbi:helix-turn-helix domain-containing protein [Butyrivibrio sp. FCS014]|uniref:helix-turn-helix domain-containing protein n=1 Tax=Butyrivibrio sp. FCS014 TaxID=1408304 RepID=UPI000463A0A9|nr:helix-turn-helix transcriptional regulator [Butyrivibrio sp. FCS014]